MPVLIRYDFRLLISTGNFGVYWIEEIAGGFVGGFVLSGTVSNGSMPWSPPANVISVPVPGVSGTYGIGAYSINGTLYTFIAHQSGGVTSTNTGISVTESTLYSVAYDDPISGTYFVITSANGRVWQSMDFVHWTDDTSGFIPAPPSTTITQGDLDAANASAPPGLTFVFGTPEELTAGGVNSHSGPPFSMRTEGGVIGHVQPPEPVSSRGGVIELTASITGPRPPTVGMGGVREQTGLPVRQEG